MIGWLLYRKTDVNRNKAYIEMYLEEGERLGIKIKLILIEDLSFGVKNGIPFLFLKNEPAFLPDFAVVRTIYPLLSRQLEYMRIKVFNNSTVAEICNDKARTYQYLSRYHIPMLDTEFIKNQDFSFMPEYEMVIKSVDGHGGAQVYLSTLDDFKEIQEGIGSSDVVIQPFLKNGCKDVRVYVIGKQIVGAVCRKAKNGFKSNFSLGGDVFTYHLKQKEIDIVNRIIKVFSFGLVGIDFLIDEQGNFVLNEIEDVVGARMLYQCTDLNLVHLYLKFILEELYKK